MPSGFGSTVTSSTPSLGANLTGFGTTQGLGSTAFGQPVAGAVLEVFKTMEHWYCNLSMILFAFYNLNLWAVATVIGASIMLQLFKNNKHKLDIWYSSSCVLTLLSAE